MTCICPPYPDSLCYKLAVVGWANGLESVRIRSDDMYLPTLPLYSRFPTPDSRFPLQRNCC
ncbi:MAG: hypothetical protein F6K50_06415 [Moorea sp. SIO3I7]|uniref:hypothetical protein n=1 Tax=unclassified Moorena TaxID=2683338 RepID=UPI0013C00765|nr:MULTISPECIES: hypothetical protein [unclassified Moorena]NEN95174.1 hypothetical protein [Moorena sp. SIO3I7]NEO08728.1 hypothetical protein [Moorena sp. SIO3I8]NEO20049.1 hypothetical protein [Moorena sp. SIO4A5]NEQ60843.1 hypothetical protein [Moorena sp. SIO4A1]